MAFSEFLVHSADVEGLCGGIDEELVRGKHRQSLLANGRTYQFASSQSMGKYPDYLRRRSKRRVNLNPSLHNL